MNGGNRQTTKAPVNQVSAGALLFVVTGMLMVLKIQRANSKDFYQPF